MRSYLMIAILLFSHSAVAELYKWKDDTGKIHYSDQPPPKSVQSTQLRTQPSAPAPVATDHGGPKTVPEKEAELRKAQQAKKDQEAKLAAQKAEADIKQKNCAAAQQNLRNLKSGVRLSEVNEKGERVMLNDSQKTERISEAENDVARYCQ